MMKIPKNNLSFLLICLIWVSLLSCAEVKEDEEQKPEVEFPINYIKVTGSVAYPSEVDGEDSKITTLTLLEDDSQSTQVDENGNFSFLINCTSLTTKNTTNHSLSLLFLSNNGSYGKQVVTTARSGRQTSLGSVSLEKTSSVTGTIALPDQQNSEGATVYLVGDKISTKADATGAFTLSNVPSGQYFMLHAEKGGEVYSVKTLIPVKDEQETALGTIGVYRTIDVNGEIEVNGRKMYSTSLLVTLNMKVSKDTMYMKISEDSNFAGAPWYPFQPTFNYQFKNAGKKTLYIKFSSSNGLESGLYQKSFEIIDSISASLGKPSWYVANKKPLFTWSRDPRVPQEKEMTYTLQLSHGDRDFNNIVLEKKNLADTSYQIEDALEEGAAGVKYYWRLGTTMDGKFWGWSSPKEFVVDTTAPILHSAFISNWDSSSDIANEDSSSDFKTASITVEQTDEVGILGYQLTTTNVKPMVDSLWSNFTGDQIQIRSYGRESIKGYLWLKDPAGNISNSVYIAPPVIRSFSQNVDDQAGTVELVAEVESGDQFVIVDSSEQVSSDDQRWKKLLGNRISEQFNMPSTARPMTLWVKDANGNISLPESLIVWGSQNNYLHYYSMDNSNSVPVGSCLFDTPSGASGNSDSSSDKALGYDAYYDYKSALSGCINRPVCDSDDTTHDISCGQGSGLAAQGADFIKQSNTENRTLKLDRKGDFFAFTGLGRNNNEWTQKEMTLSFWFNVGGFSNLSAHTPILSYFSADITGDTSHQDTVSCAVCIHSESNPTIGVYSYKKNYIGYYPYYDVEITEKYSSTTITPGQWYHMVVLQEYGRAGLFLNGKSILEVPQGHLAGDAFSFSRTFRFYPGKLASYFIGEIDEVKLFTSALKPSEIELMHNMEKLRF